MQKFLRHVFPFQFHWKGVLAEVVVFIIIYIVWLFYRSPEASNRLLIGNLAVLIPQVTCVLLIYILLERIDLEIRRTWRLIGLALSCWVIGNTIRTFYEGLAGFQLPIFSVVDVVNFLAYPFFFYALVVHPFENQYTPSRFRFLLDVIISSSVVAVLAWLVLAQTYSFSTYPQGLAPLVYPVCDLILIMILINMVLVNRKTRRTIFIWLIGLLAFTISDYGYSVMAQMGGYLAGGPESLGWVGGGLIFSVGIVFEANLAPGKNQEAGFGYDLGTRIQNILPVSLVLALFWFVMMKWKYSGEIPLLGLWMSLLLSLALIIRVGIRTGEIELYKYWQLFRSLAEPTFICDDQGRILLSNPAMVKAFGLKNANQMAGRFLTDFFESQSLPENILFVASHQDCSFEISKQPMSTPFLISLSPILADSRKKLIAGAAHDLSEQKRQQEVIQKALDELNAVYRQLEDLNRDLEQKVEQRTSTLQDAYHQLAAQNKMLQELDQLKSDFVSMVSHELRTPLTSLAGGLELLIRRKDSSNADHEPLLLMKNEVQRLTRFVENILTLSAMEAGRLEPHLSMVMISETMENVLHLLGNLKGVERICINLPVELPPVQADSGFLESVMIHLLDNALKYSHQGAIKVDAYQNSGKIRIRVTDCGPGIPREKQPLLFLRFQRLDARDSQSVYGYGLGLFLSQSMLHAMGSNLFFEEPSETGARFYFELKVGK